MSEFVTIPEFENYLINKNGVVKNKNNNKILKLKNNVSVRLSKNNKLYRFNVKKLASTIFKIEEDNYETIEEFENYEISKKRKC